VRVHIFPRNVHNLWSLPRHRCCAVALVALAGESRRRGEDRGDCRAALRRAQKYLREHPAHLPG
jgi:hypothetical protein